MGVFFFFLNFKIFLPVVQDQLSSHSVAFSVSFYFFFYVGDAAYKKHFYNMSLEIIVGLLLVSMFFHLTLSLTSDDNSVLSQPQMAKGKRSRRKAAPAQPPVGAPKASSGLMMDAYARTKARMLGSHLIDLAKIPATTTRCHRVWSKPKQHLPQEASRRPPLLPSPYPMKLVARWRTHQTRVSRTRLCERTRLVAGCCFMIWSYIYIYISFVCCGFSIVVGDVVVTRPNVTCRT